MDGTSEFEELLVHMFRGCFPGSVPEDEVRIVYNWVSLEETTNARYMGFATCFVYSDVFLFSLSSHREFACACIIRLNPTGISSYFSGNVLEISKNESRRFASAVPGNVRWRNNILFTLQVVPLAPQSNVTNEHIFTVLLFTVLTRQTLNATTTICSEMCDAILLCSTCSMQSRNPFVKLVT